MKRHYNNSYCVREERYPGVCTCMHMFVCECVCACACACACVKDGERRKSVPDGGRMCEKEENALMF